MPTLLDKIHYEHQPYNIITDEIGKYVIEKFADILKPLENEILSATNAVIIISEHGYYDLIEFKPELEKKVRDLVSASSI